MRMSDRGFPMVKGKQAIIAFAALLLGAASASACSCAGGRSLSERRDQSEMVFKGRLVSVSMDSLRGRKQMKFAVSKILWKGKRKRAKWVLVETDPESAACGFEMPVGERAIIFAHANEENGSRVYSTSLCDDNIVSPAKSQSDSLWMKSGIKGSGRIRGHQRRL
jgi:hypothetical protein